MQKITKMLNGRWIPYTIATCSAVVLYVVLTHFHNIRAAFDALFGYTFPVVMAIIIAYILDPLVRKRAERLV